MTPQEMHNRLLSFGDLAIRMAETLPLSYSSKHIGHQLIRAATSIGANYAEAQAAESKADFAHKLKIALKECRESHSWLKLLYIRQINPTPPLLPRLLNECSQLQSILGKAVLTAKSR